MATGVRTPPVGGEAEPATSVGVGVGVAVGVSVATGVAVRVGESVILS